MEEIKNMDCTEDIIESKVLEIEDESQLRKKTGDTFCFKSKRYSEENTDYQKGYNDAIDKIIEWLKEEDLSQYIGLLYSGVCSVTFNTDKLIEDLRQKMEE